MGVFWPNCKQADIFGKMCLRVNLSFIMRTLRTVTVANLLGSAIYSPLGSGGKYLWCSPLRCLGFRRDPLVTPSLCVPPQFFRDHVSIVLLEIAYVGSAYKYVPGCIVRLGIDDIIRTILTYFGAVSETRMRNLPEITAKCACKISTIPSIPCLLSVLRVCSNDIVAQSPHWGTTSSSCVGMASHMFDAVSKTMLQYFVGACAKSHSPSEALRLVKVRSGETAVNKWYNRRHHSF
jgi:hypothetical protein